jgi:hypothetical protein
MEDMSEENGEKEKRGQNTPISLFAASDFFMPE